MTGGDQSRRLGVGDQRHVIVGTLDRAEAGLGEPHAFLLDLVEVGALKSRLENHRAGNHLHAAGPVLGKATLRGDGKRLDPSTSRGRPGTCTSDAEIAVVMPPCR